MITINIAGRNYPLRFDANAISQVQKLYGNIIPALEEQTKQYEDQIRILAILVNEGIAFQNYQNSTHDIPVTEQQLGMLLTPYDLMSWGRQKIIEAFNEQFPSVEKKT